MTNFEKRGQVITDAENGKITGKELWEILTATWAKLNGIEKMGDRANPEDTLIDLN